MEKKFKRRMNACLLILLVATAAATVAHAGPCDLNKKTDITICTAEDFLRYNDIILRNIAHVILAADIDFSETGQISFPIGGQTPCTPFSGVFDGNGHTLKNIKVNTTGNAENLDGAFFCGLQGACVRNVFFDETNSFVGDKVAALALTMSGDTILTNVTSKAYVEGKYVSGGLFATGDFTQTGSGELNECTVSGTVKSTSTSGGFFGEVTGASGAKLVLNDCKSTGLVETRYFMAGGFIGELSFFNFTVAINGSTRSGTINATEATSAGGFIGLINNPENGYVTITNSVHDGTISVVNGPNVAGSVGGFIGNVNGAKDTMITIFNSTNNGDITSRNKLNAKVGGFIGSCIDPSKFRVLLDFCTNNGDINVPTGDEETYTGGLVGLFSLHSEDQNHVNVSNCENSGTVSGSPNGMTCGLFAAAHFTKGLYTGDIYNSVNKGRITGGQVYGIANEITSARLVVSATPVEGSAKSYMFWNCTTLEPASHLYQVYTGNLTNPLQATEFIQDPNSKLYFHFGGMGGPSLENVLQNVVIQDGRKEGRWTSTLGITTKPVKVSVRLFDDNSNKKKKKEIAPVSTVSWVVKSGETLSTVGYLNTFFANESYAVYVKEDKKVMTFADTIVVKPETVDIERGVFMIFNISIPVSNSVKTSSESGSEFQYTAEAITEELQQVFTNCAHFKVTQESNNPSLLTTRDANEWTNFTGQMTVIPDDVDEIVDLWKKCAILWE